jgi:hypothetical protein
MSAPATWSELFSTSFLPRWPGRVPSLAPEFLEQSGWIFGSTINVTELNSAAPDTEAAILQTKSYGRQLGRISDALQVLIDERVEKGGDPVQALTDFSTQKDEIDRVKNDAAASRISQLRKDLEALRRESADEYEQLRAELLGAHRSGNGRTQP